MAGNWPPAVAAQLHALDAGPSIRSIWLGRSCVHHIVRTWKRGQRLTTIGIVLALTLAVVALVVLGAWLSVTRPAWARYLVAALVLAVACYVIIHLRSGITVRTHSGARMTVIGTPLAVELTDFSRWSALDTEADRRLQLDARNLAAKVLEILEEETVVCAVTAPGLRNLYRKWGFAEGGSRRSLSLTTRLTLLGTPVLVRTPKEQPRDRTSPPTGHV